MKKKKKKKKMVMVDEYKRCLLFVVLLHSWLETHFEEIERAITTHPTII